MAIKHSFPTGKVIAATRRLVGRPVARFLDNGWKLEVKEIDEAIDAMGKEGKV